MKTIIKFNDINELFHISKDSDPISGAYEYLTSLNEGFILQVLSGARPDPSKVRMNRTQYEAEVIGRILLKYAKKKIRHITDKQLQMAISMLDFDIGLSVSDEIPAGEIWLLDGWLEERE